MAESFEDKDAHRKAIPELARAENHGFRGEARAGVNISDGGVQDTVAAGVVDVLATKLSAVKLAADAAITVLRVDTIIMAKPAGGPKK